MNVDSILKEVVEEFKPGESEIKEIDEKLKAFLSKVKEEIKKSKIKAEVFVGGSYPKRTMMKSKEYDVDIFIRFTKKEGQNLSDLTEKLLKNFKKTRIHGSRDYFKIRISTRIVFEVVPVLKVRNPKEAENITDLSYFHVNYIRKKLKTEKILNEVVIAKAFCHANNCYGAESYIKGFSGYGIELLIQYYGTFLKFLKETSKAKEKIIIDVEKHYKNRQEVMMNVNSAKLNSPIILIDPTFKQRNALAALSEKTFEEFQKAAKEFLKKPNKRFFETKKINWEEIKKNATRKRLEFIILDVKTNRQEGDIAGTKLLKFYEYITKEISKYFIVKNRGFEYNDGKTAKYFFVVERKKELMFNGPKLNDIENIKKFKKKHKNAVIKNGRLYAKEKNQLDIRKFLQNWEKRNKKLILEMSTELV
ncbi:hypothetical protein HYT24_01970 [Candidatus Pacearchaeota archaeon]|nr:hypothetical protein [Candidatus Pacearchaeota archaeon]